jgi:mannitol-specific phosphotransferase system IIBC component
MTQSYYTVIAILIVGILILFIVRKKVMLKSNETNKQHTQSKKQTSNTPSDTSKQQNSEVSIRFQKNIDDTNSVVMLDFMQQSYLVMMGSNNVLLDRFKDDLPTSQEEFDVILQEHQHVLDGFLNSPDTQDNSNSVKSYSQKASTISYDA